jgi:hydrogenase 3 maturation protease
MTPTTVLICVGNDMYGDDGAGPAVAKRLSGTVPWEVFDGGSAPESFLMKIAARRPGLVILVDAVDFCGLCGEVRLLEDDLPANQGPSTHGPAPLAFLEALRAIHPCRTAVLGIQPGRAVLAEPLSPPVERAVETVVKAFRIAASARKTVSERGDGGT